MTHDESVSRPSRRTIAKGAAWTVPAIAVVGVPAPAYAESGPPPTFTYIGACKFPGNSCRRAPKGYAFAFTVTNNDNKVIYVCDADLLNVVGTDINFTYTGDPCVAIPANDTGTFYFFFEGSNDSANQNFTFDLSIEWGHTCPCSDDPDGHDNILLTGLSAESTPPGGICQCDASFIS